MKMRDFGSAFWQGFADGMSSPYRFAEKRQRRIFQPKHILRLGRQTDARAWRDVGEILNQAYREVGEELVTKPRKGPAAQERHRAEA